MARELRFKKTYIEITNGCNRACSFCPKTSRSTRFMDETLFAEILRKIRPHSEFVYFHVVGEPLLHPLLCRFLDLCADFGFQVNLATNGTLIREVGDAIRSKPAMRQISFSLHSFGADSGGVTLDDYLHGIFSFVRGAQRERPLIVSLKLWNSVDRAGESPNAEILRRIQDEFKVEQCLEDRPSATGIQIAKSVFLNQAKPFEWPAAEGPDRGEKGFCLGLRDQIAILVDGTVVPCCLDAEGVLGLGNIRELSLKDIVSCPRARAMYEGFSKRRVVENLCRKCTYRDRFDRGQTIGPGPI